MKKGNATMEKGKREVSEMENKIKKAIAKMVYDCDFSVRGETPELMEKLIDKCKDFLDNTTCDAPYIYGWVARSFDDTIDEYLSPEEIEVLKSWKAEKPKQPSYLIDADEEEVEFEFLSMIYDDFFQVGEISHETKLDILDGIKEMLLWNDIYDIWFENYFDDLEAKFARVGE